MARGLYRPEELEMPTEEDKANKTSFGDRVADIGLRGLEQVLNLDNEGPGQASAEGGTEDTNGKDNGDNGDTWWDTLASPKVFIPVSFGAVAGLAGLAFYSRK